MNYEITRARSEYANRRLVLSLTRDRKVIATATVWQPDWDTTQTDEAGIQSRFYRRAAVDLDTSSWPTRDAAGTEALTKLLATAARVQRWLDRFIELQSVESNEVQRALLAHFPDREPYLYRIVWKDS